MLTVGSLFSGIGGIELGFERTRYFRTIWMIENDEFCKKILRKNFKGVKIYGDIRKIKWKELERADILTGGFPCQDISIAGKGKGIAGKRSGLWKYFNKAIRILRPKYAIIENVSMLTHRGLNVVLADLAKNGYDAEWFDLRASDFGAPHKRERIFIIAFNTNSNQHNKKPKVQRWKKIPVERTSFITNDWLSRISRHKQEKIQKKQGFSWCKDVRRVEDFFKRPYIPKPLICGSRDGIPDWVDRLKALGNAVVPDCTEFIGERIKELEKGD